MLDSGSISADVAFGTYAGYQLFWYVSCNIKYCILKPQTIYFFKDSCYVIIFGFLHSKLSNIPCDSNRKPLSRILSLSIQEKTKAIAWAKYIFSQAYSYFSNLLIIPFLN